MPAKPTTHDGEQTEEDKVIAWRFEELLRAKIEPKLAEEFADNTSIDLHLLIETKQSGATDAQLRRIFL